MSRAGIATDNMSIALQHMGLADLIAPVTKEMEKFCYDCGCDLDGEEEKERGICNGCYKEYDEERPEDVYGKEGLC